MFLNLTTAEGHDIRVNMDRIESYGTITEAEVVEAERFYGMTYLVPVGMRDDDQPYIVLQTPEQIDQLLRVHRMMA